jgi:3-hydroxyisobutyrate dehydrogenase-like beta-hydroxyacid dehydrogenase
VTTSNQTPVTVIGLGPMGSALAAALVKRGHPTTVWNRTPAKIDPLVAMGAKGATGPADAVAVSPLVIACLLHYDAVHAVLDPVAPQLRGRTLVNLTSDTPDRARQMATWAAENGIEYLDGSIMTPADTIGGPVAAFLSSGPERTYARHRTTLASLGGAATHVGDDPGRAAAFDVALLDIFWTTMSGLAHGFALAKAEGIAGADLLAHAEAIVSLGAQLAYEFARDADNDTYPTIDGINHEDYQKERQ